MALTNLGFETDGGTPGGAASWTVAVTSSAERLALFGTASPALEEEDHESEWNNDGYLFEFTDLLVVAPLFDTDIGEGETLEDFEESWSDNQAYLFALGSTDDLAADGFEADWNNNAYVVAFELDESDTEAPDFDAAISVQLLEDFEDGWRGTGADNDLELVMGSTTAASFDGVLAPESVEDFEEVRTETQVTVDPATDLFTASALHTFGVGDRVSFRLIGSGALPGGINSLFRYYVISSGLTTTAFRVSTTLGGATIDVTDAGSGSFYITHDRTRYWVIPAA